MTVAAAAAGEQKDQTEPSAAVASQGLASEPGTVPDKVASSATTPALSPELGRTTPSAAGVGVASAPEVYSDANSSRPQ
jgi:hypothetical protein